ncbi:nodal modulator 1-like [Brachionus plicatilis]|uniref:Nodal modulator 1-like n=1 Tax=Brachionus plicatilis TaxID=10195 RepID=A0A3M7STD7_BRAPC|nr:nodal modulator 1-like [Brachionus plicatilis]
MKEIFLFSLLISFIYQTCHAEDVIGCGGFIKSNTEINFKIIKVKLVTKDGALKYTTDASPVNGYYMIPVYAKGEYILQVSPPPGWSFEPEKVSVTIDGENDPCSRNEDINFFFKGFGLSGKVVSLGDSKNRGPSGVKLNLLSDGKQIDSAVSGNDGTYYFSNVMPGKYQVEAADSSFRFQTSKVQVELSKENWFAKENIVISGYKVEGFVLTEDQTGIENVAVELHIQESGQNLDTKNFECDHSLKKDTVICSVKTSSNGKFSFGNVMFGKYNLVAKYSTKNLQFFMKPDFMKVDLTKHSNLQLADNFILNSITITGKILISKDKPLKSGEVLLNGKKLLVSENGEFSMEKLLNGNYKLSVNAKNIYYEDIVININLSNRKIFDSHSNLLNLVEISPKSFDVCGQVRIKHSNLLTNVAESIKIKCFADNKLFKTVSLDNDLKYCLALDINKNFVLKAVLSEKLSKILRLVPNEKALLLTDSPVFDANFEQLEAKLEGELVFLPNEQAPNDLSVAIKSTDSTWSQNVPIKCSKDQKEKYFVTKCSFVLNNLLFGKYQLNTNYDDLYCWKTPNNQQSLTVNVNSENQKILIQQQGFKLRYKLSHKNSVLSLIDGEKNILFSRNIIKNGDLSDEICLPKKADYTIQIDSSHRFTDTKSDRDTINLKSDIFHKGANQLDLNALKHKVTVDLIYQFNDDKEKLAVNKNDFWVLVKNKGQLVETLQLELKSEQKNQITFSGKTWLAPKEDYVFTAESNKALFDTNDKQISLNEDNCDLNHVKFDSILGIFIRGTIKAKDLESIDLVLKSASDNSVLRQIKISSSSGFELGPLKAPYSLYTVELSQSGYVFNILNAEVKEGNYNLEYQALKLGQLKVNVVDVKTKSSLENVLLSLSSENRQFRQTIRTDPSGLVSFDNLKPGLYYLLLMMQEYEFMPNSHPIQISDGFNSNLVVQANRVSFSVFGKVTSINGQAETGVTVEANGLKSFEDELEAENENCRSSRENGQVDEYYGAYRIRNLRPGCVYELKMQTKATGREFKIIPDKYILNMSQTDIVDKNFVLVDQVDMMDVSVGFNYKLNEQMSLKSRKTNNFVRVNLFKTNQPDQVIQSVLSPANSIVYMNPLTRDKTQYSLSIELLFPSTVSVFGNLNQHQINQLQQLPVLDHKEFSFFADKSHKHFSFEFKGEQELKSTDMFNLGQEKYQNVYLTIPLFIILIFLVLNWTKIQSYFLNLNEKISEKGGLTSVLQKPTVDLSGAQPKAKSKGKKMKDQGSDNEIIQKVNRQKVSQANDGSSEQSDAESSGVGTIEDGDMLVLHTRKQKVKKAL